MHRDSLIRLGTALTLALGLISCATPAITLVSEERFDYQRRTFRQSEPVLRVRIATDRFTLTSPFVGGSTIRGIAQPNATNVGWRLFVTELELFGSWDNGWTAADFEASGSLAIDSRGRVSVVEPIEYWSLTRGEIRYYDTYILDDDGLRSVGARVDRVEALAEWLRENGGAPFYAFAEESRGDGPVLRTDIERILDEVFAAPADLPEWLVELGESGSVARDLREASPLLLAVYNLEYLNTTGFATMRVEALDSWN